MVYVAQGERASQVFKALLDGVQEVAVKVFHDMHTTVEEADILREVAILKGCRDRNIVQFYGACRDVSGTTFHPGLKVKVEF